MSEYRNILFLGRLKEPQSLMDVVEVVTALQARGLAVSLEKSLWAAADEESRTALEKHRVPVVDAGDGNAPDFAVVLGGDGTFLGAVRRLAPYGATLTGVNLGTLGFLTDIAREQMIDALSDIFNGRYKLEQRFMLSVRVNGAPVSEAPAVAVNDVVITRGASGALLEMQVSVNHAYAYALRADGLILSTPSGSTAYALAAGGPIVATDMEALLLVPLCPHALTYRPLMVHADQPVQIQLTKAQSAILHIDGQGDIPLRTGDIVEVSRHPAVLRICHPPGYDYFQTLRTKLRWGA